MAELDRGFTEKEVRSPLIEGNFLKGNSSGAEGVEGPESGVSELLNENFLHVWQPYQHPPVPFEWFWQSQ